jgi:hypothetical protein
VNRQPRAGAARSKGRNGGIDGEKDPKCRDRNPGGRSKGRSSVSSSGFLVDSLRLAEVTLLLVSRTLKNSLQILSQFIETRTEIAWASTGFARVIRNMTSTSRTPQSTRGGIVPKRSCEPPTTDRSSVDSGSPACMTLHEDETNTFDKSPRQGMMYLSSCESCAASGAVQIAHLKEIANKKEPTWNEST